MKLYKNQKHTDIKFQHKKHVKTKKRFTRVQTIYSGKGYIFKNTKTKLGSLTTFHSKGGYYPLTLLSSAQVAMGS